ncbi:MAG: hypothetical protein JW913_02940 [Chitinispirillaceae bacterium]|nr:hypothetical protein [Chitinispirillaceae bacterium]
MRVVVKKSIQSLHAFGRHFHGGSIAALPLYFAQCLPTFFLTIFLIVFATTSSIAQQQDTNPKTADAKRIDLLFDQIMETLPDGMRMKVDSAASMKTDRREQASKPLSVTRERESSDQKTRMHELPDELKVQVERAIENMELRKEVKKAEFRESGRNKQ